MDITTFMIAVYCLMEDHLAGQRLRKRGPQPTLRDSEVLTMEVVGEFLGIDTDSNIFTHFRRHYADWFPGMREITRTTFTRQAANLWKVKQELWGSASHSAGSLYFHCGQLSCPCLSFCPSTTLPFLWRGGCFWS